MCLFRKKKIKEIILNSKFSKGEFVKFKYRGEIAPGYIHDVKKDSNNTILYDIQIGGECPAIINSVDEDLIYKA